ncbi:MAG: hypothetical protein MASP_01253 [Candidatus Methanolliviera sp. GoM_asphalt]|nr:MAG: hypothetical protein MASP_01253 [Candidatus Methanolliviera sp. GoM_asphalt]
MKLLVSPKNIDEADASVRGGADIVDVKNPKEGSLGANFPWVIKSIREMVPEDIPVSAAIGDFNFKPGTASLAALGAAVSGADYIKTGLYGVKTEEEAKEMVSKISESIKGYDPNKKVVIAGYSDCHRINSVSPLMLPDICKDYDVDVVMVDTGVKDGRSTLEFLSEEEIKGFIDSAHKIGLDVALAGSLNIDDIKKIIPLNADIIGVRGVVCGGDRSSSIREELVKEIKELVTV